MPQSPATDGRADPYKNFRFRLRWDGQVVAGVNKVSRLKRTTEVVANRDRGTNDLPAADAGSRFEAITLEQGITVNVEFHRWATAGQARRDVDLEMYNEAGQLALAYTVHRAWVSQYQALPDLDADATAVAIAHIRLEHEGWERRDISGEPAEPHFPPTVPGDQQTPTPDAAPASLWARLSQRLTRMLRRGPR